MFSRRVRPAALTRPRLVLVPAGRAADPTDNPDRDLLLRAGRLPRLDRRHQLVAGHQHEDLRQGEERLREVRERPQGAVRNRRRPVLPRRHLRLHHQAAGARPDAGQGRGHPRRGAGRPTRSPPTASWSCRTKFLFNFRERGPAAPRCPATGTSSGWGWTTTGPSRTMDHLGIAWVHLVGATVAFGPQLDWGKTWATANSLLSEQGQEGRLGQRPATARTRSTRSSGGGKKYVDAAPGAASCSAASWRTPPCWTTSSTPATAPTASTPRAYCARIVAYGSRVLVANNLLPQQPEELPLPPADDGQPRREGHQPRPVRLRQDHRHRRQQGAAGLRGAGRHLPRLLRGGRRGARQLRLQPRPHRLQRLRASGSRSPTTTTSGPSSTPPTWGSAGS